METSILQFEKVCKTYPLVQGSHVALDGFDLNIGRREFVSIIGHSGCGKSTALMMAAGLTEISGGYIFLASS